MANSPVLTRKLSAFRSVQLSKCIDHSQESYNTSMDSVPAGQDIHPFLRGNFAPVVQEYISHPCDVQGEIPVELLGGQYIRNGGNPVYPPEKGRHYHWYRTQSLRRSLLNTVMVGSTVMGCYMAYYSQRHPMDQLCTRIGTSLHLCSHSPSCYCALRSLQSPC